MDRPTTKTCTCCTQILPVDQFYSCARSTDGFTSQCKTCKKMSSAERDLLRSAILGTTLKTEPATRPKKPEKIYSLRERLELLIETLEMGVRFQLGEVSEKDFVKHAKGVLKKVPSLVTRID